MKQRNSTSIGGVFIMAILSLVFFGGAYTPTGSQQTGDINAQGFATTNASTWQGTNIEATSVYATNSAAFPTNTTYNGTNLGVQINAATTNAEAYAAAAIASTNAARFPSADIPLGTNFTDFVFKITRNNFTNLIFYFQSADPTSSDNVGPSPNVYYTDTGNSDPRVWLKQQGTISIYEELTARNPSQPGTIASAVLAIPTVTADISSTNGDLACVYARCTSSGFEQDTYGRTIWHQTVLNWSQKVLNPTLTNY